MIMSGLDKKHEFKIFSYKMFSSTHLRWAMDYCVVEIEITIYATSLHDLLEIQKHLLQKFQNILKKCFLVGESGTNAWYKWHIKLQIRNYNYYTYLFSSENHNTLNIDIPCSFDT